MIFFAWLIWRISKLKIKFTLFTRFRYSGSHSLCIADSSKIAGDTLIQTGCVGLPWRTSQTTQDLLLDTKMGVCHTAWLVSPAFFFFLNSRAYTRGLLTNCLNVASREMASRGLCLVQSLSLYSETPVLIESVWLSLLLCHFQSSFLMLILGGLGWQLKYLSPCYPHGRLR